MKSLSWPIRSAVITGGLLMASSSFALNTFGNSTHELVDAPDAKYDYPYNAVGRLNTGCTGTLVSKHLVLTAAHCVVNSESGNPLPQLTTFELNVVDGKASQSFSVKRAWIGTYSPVAKRAKDWALVEITGTVARETRPLKLQPVDFEKETLPYTTTLVGYNMDKGKTPGGTLSRAADCSIREVTKKKEGEKETQAGLLLHDCSSVSGVSGGPLFSYDGEVAHVQAITVSERRKASESMHLDEYSSEYANIAISVQDASDMLGLLSKTVEAGTTVPTVPNVFLVDLTTKKPAATSPSNSSSGSNTAGGTVTKQDGTLLAGGNSTCALSDGGKLSCWGGGITVPTTTFSEVALGDNYACGVADTGLSCWSWGRKVAASAPSWTDVHGLKLGQLSGCAIDDKGKTRCWGSNLFDQLNAPAVSTKVEQLALGMRHGCQRTATSVTCWGSGDSHQNEAPQMKAPTQVAAGGLASCAIDEDTVKCWGFRPVSDPRAVPSVTHPKQITVGQRHACVLDDNGVRCWGAGEYGQLQVPTLDGPTEVAAGDNHTCARDRNGVVCWGLNNAEQTTVPQSLSKNR